MSMDWISGGELAPLDGVGISPGIGNMDYFSGGELVLLMWLVESGVDVTAALGLHQDALFIWMKYNAGTFLSREVVGALNELNGTVGKEYWEARQTFLGL